MDLEEAEPPHPVATALWCNLQTSVCEKTVWLFYQSLDIVRHKALREIFSLVKDFSARSADLIHTFTFLYGEKIKHHLPAQHWLHRLTFSWLGKPLKKITCKKKICFKKLCTHSSITICITLAKMYFIPCVHLHNCCNQRHYFTVITLMADFSRVFFLKGNQQVWCTHLFARTKKPILYLIGNYWCQKGQWGKGVVFVCLTLWRTQCQCSIWHSRP